MADTRAVWPWNHQMAWGVILTAIKDANNARTPAGLYTRGEPTFIAAHPRTPCQCYFPLNILSGPGNRFPTGTNVVLVLGIVVVAISDFRLPKTFQFRSRSTLNFAHR